MTSITRKILRVSAISVAVVSPVLVHFSLTHSALNPHVREALTGLMIIVQAAIALSVILTRPIALFYKIIAVGVIAVGGVACFAYLDSGLIVSSGLLHASAYSVLLAVFGASLGPGSEPIITAITRSLHGPLSPSVKHYTRNVTLAWCIFFALELMASTVLLTMAPIGWWSAFINLFNAPLIIAFFVGERLIRPVLLADPPRERIADILRLGGIVRKSFIKHEPDMVVTPPL